MTCCHQPLHITWIEPSLLVYPPDWWDIDKLGVFQPPAVQQSTHTLCLHCGEHHIDFDLGDPGNHALNTEDTNDALHLYGHV